MTPVTLSWPNSKDGANAKLSKLACHASCHWAKSPVVKIGRQVSALTSGENLLLGVDADLCVELLNDSSLDVTDVLGQDGDVCAH